MTRYAPRPWPTPPPSKRLRRTVGPRRTGLTTAMCLLNAGVTPALSRHIAVVKPVRRGPTVRLNLLDGGGVGQGRGAYLVIGAVRDDQAHPAHAPDVFP